MKSKKPIVRANIYFLIILLIQIIGGRFLVPVLAKTGINSGVLLSLVHFMFFIGPAIIYLIVTKSNAKEVLRLNKPRIQDLLWAVLIGVVAQPVMSFFALIASLFFKNDVQKFMESLNSTPYWMMLLIMAVTPAITEEITVRGIILSGYNQKNKHVAAIMSGIIFGLFHLNAQQFLYATALGILFGYMVRVTNSIFVTMVTHFMINGLQVTMQRFLIPLIQKISPEQAQAPENLTFNMKLSALCSLGVLAIIFGTILVVIIMRMEKANKERGLIQPNKNPYLELEYLDEKIINIPLILSLIIYFLIMIPTVLKSGLA